MIVILLDVTLASSFPMPSSLPAFTAEDLRSLAGVGEVRLLKRLTPQLSFDELDIVLRNLPSEIRSALDPFAVQRVEDLFPLDLPSCYIESGHEGLVMSLDRRFISEWGQLASESLRRGYAGILGLSLRHRAIIAKGLCFVTVTDFRIAYYHPFVVVDALIRDTQAAHWDMVGIIGWFLHERGNLPNDGRTAWLLCRRFDKQIEEILENRRPGDQVMVNRCLELKRRAA